MEVLGENPVPVPLRGGKRLTWISFKDWEVNIPRLGY